MENMAGEEDFDEYKAKQDADVKGGPGGADSDASSRDDDYDDEYGSEEGGYGSSDDGDDLERDVGDGLRRGR